MKKTISFLFLFSIIITANAQKKELTNEQFFKSNFKGIINSMPSGFTWIDDTHFTYSKDGKNGYLMQKITQKEKLQMQIKR